MGTQLSSSQARLLGALSDLGGYATSTAIQEKERQTRAQHKPKWWFFPTDSMEERQISTNLSYLADKKLIKTQGRRDYLYCYLTQEGQRALERYERDQASKSIRAQPVPVRIRRN